MTAASTQLSLLLGNRAALPYPGNQNYSEDNFSTNTITNYLQSADTTTTWSISGGSLTAAAGGVQSTLIATTVPLALDVKVEAVMTQAGGGGLVVRRTDVNNYYLLSVDDHVSNPANRMVFYKRVAGTLTQLGDVMQISFPRGTSHRIGFQIVGQELTAFFDGVIVGTITDNSICVQGGIGMRASMASLSNVFDAFRWSFVPMADHDCYYSRVAWHMRFDDNDGVTAFVDEKGHTVSALSSAIISTANKKWGKSSYFNPNNPQSLALINYAPDIDVNGNDFTIEGWAMTPTPANDGVLIAHRNTTGSARDRGIMVVRNSSGFRAYCATSAGVVFGQCTGASPAITANTWFHWAYTRKGNVFTLRLDGAVLQTVTEAGTCATGWPCAIGGDPGSQLTSWNGYIDDVRLTVGVNRYDNGGAAITPPLGAYPNKSFPGVAPTPKVVALLHMDGPDASTVFRDEVGTTWTRLGVPSIRNTDNLLGNGSLAFTNTGQYIEAASSPDFALGSGPWTIEFAIKTTTVVGDNAVKIIMDFRSATNLIGLYISLSTAGYLRANYGGNAYGGNGTIVGDGTWRFVQVIYDGAYLYTVANGVVESATAIKIFVPADKLHIGSSYLGLTGVGTAWIDEVRVTKGLARSFSTSNTRSFPLTVDVEDRDRYYEQVYLMLRADNYANGGTAISDDKGHVVTVNGQAAASKIGPYFGKSSLVFPANGSNSYLSIAVGTSLKLSSTESCCFEFWIRANDSGREQVVIDYWSAVNGWKVGISDTGNLAFWYVSTSSSITVGIYGTSLVADGNWHHCAVQLVSGTVYVMVDGALENFQTIPSFLDWTATALGVGAQINTRNAALDFCGFLSDLRITREVRYQLPFKPQRHRFTNLGPDYDPYWAQTIAYLPMNGHQSSKLLNDETGRWWGIAGSGSVSGGGGPLGESCFSYGNTSGLIATDSPDFAFDTGAFVIEGSFLINEYSAGGVIATKRSTTAGFAPFLIATDSSTGQTLSAYLSTNGTTWALTLTSTDIIPLETWVNWSLQRTATGWVELRINGKVVNSGLMASSLVVNTAVVSLAYDVGGAVGPSGGMAKVRFTKGVARYYGSKPAAELTYLTAPSVVSNDPSWASVSLLLRCDNQLIGSPAVDLSPFAAPILPGGTAVATNITTGAGRTGTGGIPMPAATDIWTIANHAGFDFNIAAFTVEFWVFQNALTANTKIFDMRASGAGTPMVILLINDSIAYFENTTILIQSASGTGIIKAGVWQHIAITRKADRTLTTWVDGVATTPNSISFENYGGSPVTIGGNVVADSGGLVGFMDDVRITKGVARYTANFTPPVRGLPAAVTVADRNKAKRALYLRMDGTNGSTTFTDQMGHTVVAVGTPQISTAASALSSGSSLLCNGSSALMINAATDMLITEDDFTIRLWINITTLQAGRWIFTKGTGSAACPVRITTNGNNKVQATFFDGDGNFLAMMETKAAVTTAQWYHIEVARKRNKFFIFLNGVLSGQTTATGSLLGGPTPYVIGAQSDGSNGFIGYIDEVLVYLGVCLHTESFRLPYFRTPNG